MVRTASRSILEPTIQEVNGVFKGLGNLANLGSLLKQAQQMSGRLAQVTDELKARRATGNSGGGMVTVEVNGLGEVLACRIDPSLVASGDRELIEDLLPGAINEAVVKSKAMHAEAMRSMAEGLNVPGLDGMLAQLAGNDPFKPPS
jgi:nucleoid-associated protein EbfC